MILANTVVKLLVDFIIERQDSLPNVTLDEDLTRKCQFLLRQGVQENRLHPLIVDSVLANVHSVLGRKIDPQFIVKLLEQSS